MVEEKTESRACAGAHNVRERDRERLSQSVSGPEIVLSIIRQIDDVISTIEIDPSSFSYNDIVKIIEKFDDLINKLSKEYDITLSGEAGGKE